MKWRRRLGFLLATALIAAVIYTGLQVYLRQMVDRHLHTTAQTMPGLEDIQYARLDIQLLPFGIELRQVVLKPTGGVEPIPIDQVHLDRFQPGATLPDRLSLILEGIRIHQTHPIADPVRDLMQRLTLKHLEMDLHIRLEHDEEPTDAWRGHAELKFRQAGILRIALAIDNLDAQGVLRALDNPVYWIAVLPPAGIRAMVWEFEDDGLVARIVDDRARRAGVSTVVARQQVRQEIEAVARTNKISALGRVLSEFVAEPGRIGYYTGNPEPVYIGGLVWSRQLHDWLRPLKVTGYRASTPRVTPWVPANAATPGKPPRL